MKGGFGRRVILYLFGVAIGCGLIYAMFGSRAGDFLKGVSPSFMVRKEIKELPKANINSCFLECAGMSVPGLEEYLHDADVDFELSSTDTDPRVYYIEGQTLTDQTVSMMVAVGDSARIANLQVEGNECDC